MAELDSTQQQLGYNLLRVRLCEIYNKQIDPYRTFLCNVMPTISESQTVNYETFDPIHGPGSILSFVNTPSRTFQLGNVRLISRTSKEADSNIRYLNLLRSWTKPTFGQYAVTDYESGTGKVQASSESSKADPFSIAGRGPTTRVDVLGAPPKVLEFSAYSAYSKNPSLDNSGHINSVPVVVTSLGIQYPDDVDYISSTTGTPMPIIMALDISLTEVHSPTEYSNFNIAQYRQGKLVRF